MAKLQASLAVADYFLATSAGVRRYGRATLAKHGVEHFREIGKRGFQSFTDRYFAGDRQQAGDWLRTRAHEKRIDSFVEPELARRLEAGEKTVCEEMPCFSGPDDGVPF
ncbi:MAG TPA: hypothetical protein VKP69_32525 [Isosphaeraceae bacterium]|nr:hypothetical protein [Isosphaeraceae bacterium]